MTYAVLVGCAGLGERGAVAIGNALKDNASLLFLDVSSNRIGEEGTKAIAEGIKENQTLRSLQLNGNPIGDHGVMLIIESVGAYRQVRDLGLQDCSTNKTGAGIFDPLNPTGRFSLELVKEHDREVLKR
jgi:Ran GTPase-activating protein (RanGAP) involved in mRNA processing and transport